MLGDYESTEVGRLPREDEWAVPTVWRCLGFAFGQGRSLFRKRYPPRLLPFCPSPMKDEDPACGLLSPASPELLAEPAALLSGPAGAAKNRVPASAGFAPVLLAALRRCEAAKARVPPGSRRRRWKGEWKDRSDR